MRRYPTTDVIVGISVSGEVTMLRYGGFDKPYMGSIADISRSADGVDCRANFGRYVPWNPSANMLSRPAGK